MLEASYTRGIMPPDSSQSRTEAAAKEVSCSYSSIQQPFIRQLCPANSTPPGNCLYRSLVKQNDMEEELRERQLLQKLKKTLSEIPEEKRLVSVDALPQLWIYVKERHIILEKIASKTKLFLQETIFVLQKDHLLACDPQQPLGLPTYWQVAKLGSGSFKNVWLIVDLCHKRIFSLAITQLSPHRSQNLACIQEHEAYNLLADAKNILRVYGIYYWSYNNKRYQGIMTKYSNGELFELLSNGTLSAAQRWKIALESAIGLQSLHNKKLLHRDMKLENILVHKTDKEKIKEVSLVDFGLSEREEQEHALSGSPSYMAPEILAIYIQRQEGELGKKKLKDSFESQWLNKYGAEEGGKLVTKVLSSLSKAQITRKTDIYALGVIFWGLFLSTLPTYANEHLSDLPLQPYKALTDQQIEVEQLDNNTTIGKILKAICATLPEERPTIEEVIEQLQNSQTVLIEELKAANASTYGCSD